MTYKSVAEMASELGVSKMTIYRLIHDGEIKSVRVGRSFRVSEESWNDYLTGIEYHPGDEPKYPSQELRRIK